MKARTTTKARAEPSKATGAGFPLRLHAQILMAQGTHRIGAPLRNRTAGRRLRERGRAKETGPGDASVLWRQLRGAASALSVETQERPVNPSVVVPFLSTLRYDDVASAKLPCQWDAARCCTEEVKCGRRLFPWRVADATVDEAAVWRDAAARETLTYSVQISLDRIMIEPSSSKASLAINILDLA